MGRIRTEYEPEFKPHTYSRKEIEQAIAIFKKRVNDKTAPPSDVVTLEALMASLHGNDTIRRAAVPQHAQSLMDYGRDYARSETARPAGYADQT